MNKEHKLLKDYLSDKISRADFLKCMPINYKYLDGKLDVSVCFNEQTSDSDRKAVEIALSDSLHYIPLSEIKVFGSLAVDAGYYDIKQANEVSATGRSTVIIEKVSWSVLGHDDSTIKAWDVGGDVNGLGDSKINAVNVKFNVYCDHDSNIKVSHVAGYVDVRGNSKIKVGKVEGYVLGRHNSNIKVGKVEGGVTAYDISKIKAMEIVGDAMRFDKAEIDVDTIKGRRIRVINGRKCWAERRKDGQRYSMIDNPDGRIEEYLF